MTKLFHDDTLIGLIKDPGANGFDWHGLIDLAPDAKSYQALFDFFTDEGNPENSEPPFSKELLENWYIENDKGVRQEIGIPGIFTRTGRVHVMWRYY